MSDAALTTEVDVVMACYSEDRWTSIVSAIESIRGQSLRPRSIIIGVDNNRALADRLAAQFDCLTIVANDGAQGASSTRNRAVEVATATLTAFLDDDEIAAPDWLLELVRPFAVNTVVGTGGCYVDMWMVGRPDWFPAEFAWVVGGAYEGMPTITSDVRNVWSGNMAVRTESFRAVGGFRTDFGKKGQASQPEDTDLCIRMAALSGGRWMYVPSAVIQHEVPAARSSFRFFASRCYNEGAGKALMRNNFDSAAVIGAERSYVLRTARAAVRRLLTPKRGRQLQGLAMLVGLACAAVGYGGQLIRLAIAGRGPAQSPERVEIETAA